MVKDQSDRILKLSRDIRDLTAELDRLLHLQASRSAHTSAPAPAPVPSSTQQTPAHSFCVGDIVRITNRYGGYKGQLASVLDTSAKQTLELKLLHSGETLTKRRWNVDFVRRSAS